MLFYLPKSKADSIIITMNVLLVIGLVLFVCIFIWLYILFLSNIVSGSSSKKIEEKYSTEQEMIKHCTQLYEEGMHTELQRFAQKELSKNYSNIKLRKILADSFLATGKEQFAIMHYEAILSIDPYDTKIQNLLAKYYSENGPKNKAIELYKQIILYDGANIDAVSTLAKLYEETKDYTGAIETYKMILDAESEEGNIASLKAKLADLYVKSEDYKKAYDAYKELYEADSDNLEVLMILADLGYKNQYWEDCLSYYEKIVSVVGDDYEMLVKIAQINMVLGNYQQTIELYNKIASMEDKESSSYFYHQNELCNAMLKNGQQEQAIALLKELLIKNPKESSIAFTLAQAYTTVGKFQEGVDLYNSLLGELSSEQNEIIINYISNLICVWAQDLFKKGQYNQAFDKFFEALKYNEGNDEVYYQLGKCNYLIKSFQDAIAHFKRAITIKPEESKYYFGLGCAYDEMGLIKNAKAAFYDAININPQDVKARIAYAIILTKELEYAQSVEQFLEVLKYVPDDADTLYNLALAYELAGDTMRATNYYKEALAKNENHIEARHNLELLLGEPYVPDDENEEYIE